MFSIYLDNNATTKMATPVIEACIEEMYHGASNPSSIHTPGRAAKSRLIKARDLVAGYFNVASKKVIFTSGATEALNMILRGMKKRLVGKHIITSNVEHAAVYQTLLALEQEGVEVTYLPAGHKGYISQSQVEEVYKPTTQLIILMAVNNETGVITPIESIGKWAKDKKIPFIVDATAAIGKISPFLLKEASAFVCSAHKFHGPKGIGAVILQENLILEPQITGGYQEYSLRAGTENLVGIIGFAKAIELIDEKNFLTIKQLRDYFESQLISLIPNLYINGEGPRVCNTSNLSFLGEEGEVLLMKLDLEGIYASHGSACSSGSLEPSRVLMNMELGKARVLSALRFSFSRYSTIQEIELTIQKLQKILCLSNTK